MKTSTKRTYSERGKGRLYIRGADGKEHKAGSGHKGLYYLEYRLPTGRKDATGKEIVKRKKVRLTLEDGITPIESKSKKAIEQARDARERIVDRYLKGSQKDRLLNIKADIETAEQKQALAENAANPPLSIAEAWDSYYASNERPDSGADTLRRYNGYWLKFTEWMEARDPNVKFLRDITTADARNYAAHLVGKKISPNTYNKHTGFLKLLFTSLTEPARISANPFEKIKRKKLKTEARRELSIEELQIILGAATAELKTLLYIGTFTGLRLGDCATLKWGEVDLTRGIIRRVPNKTKSHDPKPVTIGIPGALQGCLSETPPTKRKGNVIPKYAELYLYENKDGKRIRQSLITEEVQAHFRRLGINTHKAGTGTQLKPDPDNPGEYIEEKTEVRAVVEVGFHSLRHTFVSIQAERGTPQAVVQAIVGHGNPAMTQHYTHIGESAARQAAKALDSGITDAEFEEIKTPHPKGARKQLEAMKELSPDTIKKIRQLEPNFEHPITDDLLEEIQGIVRHLLWLDTSLSTANAQRALKIIVAQLESHLERDEFLSLERSLTESSLIAVDKISDPREAFRIESRMQNYDQDWLLGSIKRLLKDDNPLNQRGADHRIKKLRIELCFRMMIVYEKYFKILVTDTDNGKFSALIEVILSDKLMRENGLYIKYTRDLIRETRDYRNKLPKE